MFAILRDRLPAITAALVNAAIVTAIVLGMLPWRPLIDTPRLLTVVLLAIGFIAWRTYTHAVRVRAGLSTGVLGLAEAAGLGFVLPLFIVIPGLSARSGDFGTRFGEIAFSVLVLGGYGLVIGGLIGALLYGCARLVLLLWPRP